MWQAGHRETSVRNAKAAFFFCHDRSGCFDSAALRIALSHCSGALNAMPIDELVNCSHALHWKRLFPLMQCGLNQRSLFEGFIRLSY
jgi:hypothetical protein